MAELAVETLENGQEWTDMPKMSPRERRAIIDDVLSELNEDAVLFDGLDHALVGIAERFGSLPLAVYDYDAILGGLVDEGLDPDEAAEHISFNISGLWAGDGTPVIIRRVEGL